MGDLVKEKKEKINSRLSFVVCWFACMVGVKGRVEGYAAALETLIPFTIGLLVYILHESCLFSYNRKFF